MWNKFKNLFQNKDFQPQKELSFTDNIQQNHKILKKQFENVDDMNFRKFTMTDTSGTDIELELIFITDLIVRTKGCRNSFFSKR